MLRITLILGSALTIVLWIIGSTLAISPALGWDLLLALFFWLITICLAAAAVKLWWVWTLVLSPLCMLVLMALAGRAGANTLLIELKWTGSYVPMFLFGLLGLTRADARQILSHPE